MYIIFDTETTGLPKNWKAPITDTDNWPRCVQLAWQLHDDMGRLVEANSFLIQPNGFDIPYDAEKIHGISTALAQKEGVSLETALQAFNIALNQAKFVVGQNIEFDLNIMGCEFHRLSTPTKLSELPTLDTCSEQTAELCRLPGGKGGRFKLPTLTELHDYLFHESFEEAHNATADVEATARCFFELIRIRFFDTDALRVEQDYYSDFTEVNPTTIQKIGLQHINLKLASQALQAAEIDSSVDKSAQNQNLNRLEGVLFSHLHNHTQFSILQSTMRVEEIVHAAIEEGMPALALTDAGNMMAAFEFENIVAKANKKIAEERQAAEEKGEVYKKIPLLPIIGCALNVCKNKQDKSNKDNGHSIVFLAKNKNGYRNLSKLSSIAYTEGFYYVPRIDKEDVVKFKNDLIVLSGNLSGEIPNLILNTGEQEAEKALLWWKKEFGDDFYLEIMRHRQEDEDRANQTLLKFAQKHSVKIVATNNTYYRKKEDASSQDVLLCIRDGALVSAPKGKGRGFRYGLESEEYYFKSQAEMKTLFADIPEAILHTNEIVSKCESYPLAQKVVLPKFDIPEEFQDANDLADNGTRGENNYLRHLAYEGAIERYGETLSEEIRSRLDFELETIANTGYPGYFLIVQDFCRAAREMDVSVGPGRGSAAGSVVAYCCKITNVDPIKYDLLFERFLNPERVSMPDIDIDFEDNGRGKVINYVIQKYGASQVAQIITYGTMAAKSSIRDAARVLDLPLARADELAKLVPNISLSKLFTLEENELAELLKKSEEEVNKGKELRSLVKGKDLSAKVIQQALRIEGTVRNTGIHACGVIITPDNITNFVPVATAKDSEMWCTQFDNHVVESAGLLKMDFLGLRTLTIIKDAVRNIKKSRGIDVDIEAIPIDDPLTYQLFQHGETIGIFQYESTGMQKHLRNLKPTVFADLIAMNALFRPGPMDYIPSFIKRKNGDELIEYDLDACKEYLEETYGITVYQEQVMLLSQSLAGFTKGEADVLRKAMGKKQADVLAKMKPKFIEQGNERGHNKTKLEKIWKDWEAFASYAFNKSHSTCYAWVAYQTAYLKANYPAEFMASILSNNMSDLKVVRMFMEDCKRMNIHVLGPDINESVYQFTVNESGDIRFGLGAIKGLGQTPITRIIEDRDAKGKFTSIFDLTRRIDLRVCNKKSFEGMALAGCFDSWGIKRSQLFYEVTAGRIFLENVMKYGASAQGMADSSQVSIFDESEEVNAPEPEFPDCDEWDTLTRLNKEKEVIGIYISGHPLDDYALDINTHCNTTFESYLNPEEKRKNTTTMAGVILSAEHRLSKRGDQFATIDVEDFTGTARFNIFGDSYLKFKHLLTPSVLIYMTGNMVSQRFNRDQLEFRITNIELLSSLKDKITKKLSISVNTGQVNETLLEQLQALFAKHAGKHSVGFSLHDEKTNESITMPSRTTTVNLNQDLLSEISTLDLAYKLVDV